MDKIDLNIGTFLCTSTTRPTAGNLFTGQQIYETDTKRVMLYTGSSWISVTPQVIFKGTSQQYQNTISLQNDTVFKFTLEPGGRYLFDLTLNATNAGTVGDLNTDWTGPGDVTGVKFISGPSDNVASQLGVSPFTYTGGYIDRTNTMARLSAHGFATAVPYNLETNGVSIREWGWVESASGGTFQFRFAQRALSATPSVIEANSFMVIWKVQ